MRDGFRQTMAFLHSWAGLVPGWLMYAVFLTGSLTYYRQEISLWMRPELSGAAADAQAVRHAFNWLQRDGADATLWRIDLPTMRNPVTEVLWKGETGGFRKQDLDPRTGGALHVRETMGGDFLFYFHFDLNGPGRLGRWLVCFAAIVMPVAIISGVITHRRIFADFFTFRPNKGQRSWLDAHNVLGVASLPYHLMISFTGLIALATMFMPWPIQQGYQGKAAAYARDLAGEGTVVGAPRPASAPIDAARVEAMVREAGRIWRSGAAGRILVDMSMRDAATITIERRDSDGVSYDRPWLRFRPDGVMIARYDGGGPAVTTHGWLYGLHLARFSAGGLRLLFFLSGLTGAAMIASGLVLWVVKRRPRHANGTQASAAERINVAVIVGLPLAIAALLLANRLLPAALAGRARWEAFVFFLTWFAAYIHAFCVAPRSAWRWQASGVAMLCLAAPIPALFTPGNGLPAWIASGDSARASIDLALIVTGLGCLGVVHAMRRRGA